MHDGASRVCSALIPKLVHPIRSLVCRGSAFPLAGSAFFHIAGIGRPFDKSVCRMASHVGLTQSLRRSRVFNRPPSGVPTHWCNYKLSTAGEPD